MKNLTEILQELEKGKISADHAESEVLRLFSVMKSVCDHPKEKWIWEMNNKDAHCGLCGEQIEQTVL